MIEVPLKSIRRPLQRTRTNNQEKVEALVKSISVRGLLVPIDVLEVDGTLSSTLFQKVAPSNFERIERGDVMALVSENVPCLPRHGKVWHGIDAEMWLAAGKYYGFSGCHRFEAFQRLEKDTIPCRVRKANQQTLRMHLM